jgi:ADP-ribose pyrophosphatase YjhB (NUDIX family)
VLLVLRGSEPGSGEWSLPGGVVELGESLMAAVKREVWEEASIRIEVKGLVEVLDRIFRDSNGKIQYHYVLVDYWAQALSGLPAARSDVRDLKWVSVEELDRMKVRPELKAVVQKAVAMREEEQMSGEGVA